MIDVNNLFIKTCAGRTDKTNFCFSLTVMELPKSSYSRIKFEGVITVANGLTDTVTLLKKLRHHVVGVVECYAETRTLFLKDEFKGKAPHTAIVLDQLQRYNHGDLINEMVSYDYSLNQKALKLVFAFGDTFKSLYDFVDYMLTKKGKMSTELQAAIVKLHTSLFHTMIFLQNFKDILKGKRSFQTIFSTHKVAEFNQAIAKVLPAATSDLVDDMRNWYIFEQVYIACDNIAVFVDVLLLPFKTSCL